MPATVKKTKLMPSDPLERLDASSNEVALRGEDGGEMGLMVRFSFTPDEQFLDLGDARKAEVLITTLEPLLRAHCAEIGWYPDERWGKGKYYAIKQQEDGAYYLISYLHKGVYGKDLENIETAGDISINEI